jgi:hypothetical protein
MNLRLNTMKYFLWASTQKCTGASHRGTLNFRTAFMGKTNHDY